MTPTLHESQPPTMQTMISRHEFVIAADHVKKQLSPRELANYEIIERYRAQLAATNPNVIFPTLVGPNTKPGLFMLSKLPGFDPFGIPEYFGMNTVVTPADFQNLLLANEHLRTIIPVNEFPDAHDDEDLDSLITFLQRFQPQVEAATGFDSTLVFQLLESTQPFVATMPQAVSHKDLNWGNWSTTDVPLPEVRLVDIETMGPSRIGFDEGRLWIYQCLDPAKQAVLLDVFHAHHGHNPDAMLYFLRTVMVRAYRELGCVCGGTYDRSIGGSFPEDQDQLLFRAQLVEALSRNLNWALKELSSEV